MIKILQEYLNKLKLKFENLTKGEKETFKEWERILSEGEGATELFENELFQKGLKEAEARLELLLNQLLNPDNEPKKETYLKAEINHILKTFATFKGAKKQKEILEAHIRQLME